MALCPRGILVSLMKLLPAAVAVVVDGPSSAAVLGRSTPRTTTTTWPCCMSSLGSPLPLVAVPILPIPRMVTVAVLILMMAQLMLVGGSCGWGERTNLVISLMPVLASGFANRRHRHCSDGLKQVLFVGPSGSGVGREIALYLPSQRFRFLQCVGVLRANKGSYVWSQP